jgi:5'-3' exonuclease
MGIPYYFSYIIKNYGNIIKKIHKNLSVDGFFLDSNSIIYDAIFNTEYGGNKETYETEIIVYVCEKI